MVLLITGAVVPGQNVSDTKLTNIDERKAQYIEAINKCIQEISKVKAMVSGIVYADNSMPDDSIFADCMKQAKEHDISFEVVSFKGDADKLSEKGKGYGEGEITEYAFNNSKLLKNSDYFIKLTGRLSIDNLAMIIKKINKKNCYFNMPNRTLPYMCDTRLYAMPVSLYKQYFIKAYINVDDNNGHYLEHCMSDVINGENIKIKNFPVYPRYVGISGSLGHVYTYNKYKSLIKDVLSIFGYYTVKKKKH